MASRPNYSSMLTLEQYEALPDDDRFIDELSRGVLEPRPGSEHGRLVARLTHLLMNYVDAHPSIGVVLAESGFLLSSDPPTVRGPDVAFVRAERMAAQSSIGFFDRAPDLAIEVLSPGNRAGETLQKISEFLDAGTELIWVIDPCKRVAIVYEQTGTVRVISADEVLECPPFLPGFSLVVSRILEI